MRPLEIEAELAELNLRLTTRKQLGLVGVSARQIRSRLARGQMFEVVPDVFSDVAPTNDYLARSTALCLRYPKGFVSGAAGARYWGMRKSIPDLYEFSVPATCRPVGVSFALFHYVIDPSSHVFEALGGLRVSSAARCVFESAGRLDEFHLRSMIQSGLDKKRFTLESLKAAGADLCTPGRRGTRLFRLVTEMASMEPPVQSEAELIMLDALRGTGLVVEPQCPIVLPSGATIHTDAGVPAARVGVEVDGPPHDEPIAVHCDKSRDLQAAAQLWQLIRVPEDDVKQRLRSVLPYIVRVCRLRTELFARAAQAAS